jgi:hypothetical protein
MNEGISWEGGKANEASFQIAANQKGLAATLLRVTNIGIWYYSCEGHIEEVRYGTSKNVAIRRDSGTNTIFKLL